ncbi:MAG: hypothetical protein ABIG20_01865 [archaeon]
MLPLFHLIVGLVAAAGLYNELGAVVLLIVAVSVLIDVDHYIYYFRRTGDVNIRSAYDYFLNLYNASDVFLAFHNIEVLVVFYALSFYSTVAVAIFIGLALHVLFDLVGEVFYKNTGRNFSLVLYLIKK